MKDTLYTNQVLEQVIVIDTLNYNSQEFTPPNTEFGTGVIIGICLVGFIALLVAIAN